jgi:hypothetical protein
MKVTGEIQEVRSDIRRSLLAEMRTLLQLGGFPKPNMMTVRYSVKDKQYIVQMAFGAAIHLFTINGTSISINEGQTVFESLAVDARVPIAEEL